MLRFRPIAPKPDTGDSGTGGFPVVNNQLFVVKKKVKRKYVRVCKNNRCKNKQGSEKAGDGSSNKVFTLLQLLPEKSDLNESSDLDRTVTTEYLEDNHQNPQPMWVGFGASDRTVVKSWVTVESVTDKCMEVGGEIGSTDVEKVNNLERDTCPGFISDGLNKVTWVNEAYRMMVMVSQQRDGQLPGMEVVLVVKEKLPRVCLAFSCRVRLQYTWQNDKCSKMVPCDVWRMDFGGFAWRLDVKAALSLGL